MSDKYDNISNDSIGTFDVRSANESYQQPLSQLTDKSNNNASLFKDSSSINDASLDQQKDDNASLLNDYSLINDASLDHPNDNISHIINTTLDSTVMKVKMSNFDVDTPSTHLFVKPTRGTLNQWEYESRKYLFISLLKPLIKMHENEPKYKRLAHQITFKKINIQYKQITGQIKFPPFFQFDTEKKKYIQMTDVEISKYIEIMLKNIGRVKNTINKFINEVNIDEVNNKHINEVNNEHINEVNNKHINVANNEHINKISNNNSTINPQDIVKLSSEIALNVSNSKRKQLFDILTSFKNINCNKRLKR